MVVHILAKVVIYNVTSHIYFDIPSSIDSLI